MANLREQWPGGYIRQGAKGRAYIIRRMVDGTRYEISTGAKTLRGAIAQLERFEADPAGYRPGGGGPEPIYLDAKLATEYLEACAGNSAGYLRAKRANVAWWAGHLRRVDLRRATLREHILPPLKDAPQRNQRVAVIKHLYSWLREQDRIKVSEDPCVGKLAGTPPKPAQHEASKVISPEDYHAARSHMIGPYRDAIDLLAGTGWHVREVVRFAAEGEIEPYAGPDPEGAAVLTVWHKSGAMHRTIVTKEAAQAATRLRARGAISESQIHRTLLAACRAAGITPFRAGWFRHTIADMAWSSGHAQGVPAFLGHRSSETTRKFYATRATPPRVPTLR